MALWSNHPLKEISTRNIPRGKAGQCVGLTILPPSCADFHEVWEPRGLSRPVQGLLYLYIHILYDKPFRKTIMIRNYKHCINILLSKLLL
jgi:hypothetical protein